MKLKFGFTGYRWWKQAKKELEFSTIYILPSISIHQSEDYKSEGCLAEVIFNWLFWELNVYLEQ